MLTSLSHIHRLLGASRITRRALPAPPLQRLGRAWLRRTLLRDEPARPDDVTVVIGVQNRADHRLANALRSLRAQAYPAELIRITVVDYGSELAGARRAEAMCREHEASYVRVDDVSVWSRSRCLNVAIRLAGTKFLMTSDVDVLLSPRYLADAVRELTASPLSVVCSAMLDLPEESAEVVEQSALAGEELPLEAWKQWCTPRYGWFAHPSICVALTAVYQALRGFDEYYELWGCEDQDLLRRLVYLGMRPTPLRSGSFYLHQWHPRADWEHGRGNAPPLLRNRAHFARSHSLLRNGPEWGSTAAAFERAATREVATAGVGFEPTAR